MEATMRLFFDTSSRERLDASCEVPGGNRITRDLLNWVVRTLPRAWFEASVPQKRA
jgi:hypothetical protein